MPNTAIVSTLRLFVAPPSDCDNERGVQRFTSTSTWEKGNSDIAKMMKSRQNTFSLTKNPFICKILFENNLISPLAMGCDNKRVDQRYPRPVRRLSFPIESSTSEILRAIIEGGQALYLYDFRSFLCKRLLWYELWCPNIEAGHLSPRRYSYRGDIRFEMLSQRDAVKRERPSQDLHPQERSPFFSAQYFPKYISQWGRSLNLGESYFGILVSS